MSKWDKRFMKLAHDVASWSKDPSTQVGCVIVNDKKQVMSLGYNGFPRHVLDTPSVLNDRNRKYQMVIHAEVNAILNSVGSVEECTVYVTHKPCSNCTGVLIQSGVKRIVYMKPEGGIAERFAESFNIADTMLRQTMIRVDEVDGV